MNKQFRFCQHERVFKKSPFTWPENNEICSPSLWKNDFVLGIIQNWIIWKLKCPLTDDISSRKQKTNNKCFEALLSTGLREVTESFELLRDNKLEKSIFIEV